MTNSHSRRKFGLKEVDKGNPLPFYLQVIEELNAAIERGVFSPGDQIPSGSQLCEIFGVSRSVIRQALKELEYEGLIRTIRGKGSFINDYKISKNLVQNLRGFHQNMEDKGVAFHTKVLSKNLITAPVDVASHLQMSTQDQVFKFERLRFVDGKPILVVTNYLPYTICPALKTADLSKRSLYRFLKSACGIVIANGWRSIEAMVADDYLADVLDYEIGGAVMLVESVTFAEDNTPIEYFVSYHRGDRTRFDIDLVL